MSGCLVAFVGPSGAGKDSLIRAVHAARPDTHPVRRVITRPAGAGGEDFEAVSAAEFEAREAAGAFLLSWRAHGLAYGIPKEVSGRLARGSTCLVNLSRGILAEAAARVPRLVVLSVTASPETLARRLALRGRETPADIRARLGRTDPGLPAGITAVTIANDDPLELAVAEVLRRLQPESA